MNVTKVFIHGLDSSSKGTKALFFKERYPEMIVSDFEGDLDERMKTLNTILGAKQDLVLIGSSFGGLMTTLFALKHPERIRKLVLLAPALCFREYRLPDTEPVDMPVIIYHGDKDDIVPLGPVRKIADHVFSNLAFHVVDDDHLLHKAFRRIDWDNLLST